MQTVGRALTWEFWRKAAVWVALAPVSLALLPSLVYGAFRLEGFTSFRTTEAGPALHFAFFAYSVAYIIASIYTGHRGLSWRFTLPVSTWSLVGWPMVNASIAAAVMVCGLAIYVNLLFDVGWPLLGPALVAATAVTCAAAIAWSLIGCRTLQIAAGVVAALLFGRWLLGRYEIVSRATQTWPALTSREVLALTAIMVAAYLAAVIGIARARRGQTVTLEGLGHWIAQRRGRRPSSTLAVFASADSALLWCEWQRRGRVYPAAALLASLSLICLCMSPRTNAHDAFDLIGGFSSILVLLGFLVGMYLGHRTDSLEMGSFDATRPVGDARLATAILKNAMLSTLSAAVIWAVGVAAAVGWFMVAGQGAAIAEGLWATSTAGDSALDVPLVVVGALATWTLVGLVLSLTLGRKWLLPTILYVAGAVPLVFGLLVRFVVPHHLQHAVIVTGQVALGLGCLFGSGIAWTVALRRRLVAARTLAVAVTMWLAMITLLAAWLPGLITRFQLTPTIVVLGLSTLPFAPFVLAPLALSWNRHR